MGIETLIKTHKLSVREANRVRKVCRIGNEVVDTNVNHFLYNRKESLRVKLNFVSRSYGLKIMDEHTMKARINSWCYGYCDYKNKTIVLNLDHVLNSGIEEIAETILHESAHAVAYHLHGDGGHGKHWKRVSRLFGSSPLAKSPMEENLAAKVGSKYKLVVLNDKSYTVELVGTAGRKLKDLHNKWAAGRRETKGMLWLVRTEDFERYGKDFDNIANVAIR